MLSSLPIVLIRLKVSTLGNVKSLDRLVVFKDGRKRKFKGKIKSCRKNNRGYLQVILYKNDKSFNYLVHRLVAKAFLPNPESLPQVDHIDNDQSNNKLSNLQWISNRDNTLKNSVHGERAVKLSLDNVRDIKKILKQRNDLFTSDMNRQQKAWVCIRNNLPTVKDISKMFNVSDNTILRIDKGQTFAYVTI